MSHIRNSETGMIDHRLVGLVKTEEGLKVQVRWQGLLNSEDNFKNIWQIYADVPTLLLKVLKRKNTPSSLVQAA